MSPPSRRARSAQIISFAFVGLLAGLAIGYVFIGSIDRIMRITSERSLETVSSDSKRYSQNSDEGEQIRLPESVSKPEDSSTTATGKMQRDVRQSFPTQGDTFHTLCTSNGSPYLNFQTRVMYGTYKLVQGSFGGDKLVGFTRILHRTQPDVLMDEVPTFRAKPLTPECDGWCEFPVSDRPNAVAQFFAAAKKDPSMIKAPWLLMLEGDYVWMKPLQAPRAESPLPSWAFPYNYIQPQHPRNEEVLRLMYPAERGPLSDIPPSGPAPVLMRVQEWMQVTPDWERLTAHIEAHEETKKKLGWVREMYAFSIAVALQGIKLDHTLPPDNMLMAQPPADHKSGMAALLHYTWGVLVEEADGSPVWTFDKRTYTASEIERKSPTIPLPPKWKPGWKLHDGTPYTEELAALVESMLQQMNAAISKLPEL